MVTHVVNYEERNASQIHQSFSTEVQYSDTMSKHNSKSLSNFKATVFDQHSSHQLRHKISSECLYLISAHSQAKSFFHTVKVSWVVDTLHSKLLFHIEEELRLQCFPFKV